MRSLILALALGLALPGCGGDDEIVPPGNPADASEGDAPPSADAAPAIGVGEPCDLGSECADGLTCLDEGEQFPPGGYCSKTCTTDEECGGDAFCSQPVTATRLCLRRCEGGACAGTGQICHTSLGGTDVGGPFCFWGDAAAEDGDACGSQAECDANSICVTNLFEAPGGYCMTAGCTPGAAMPGCAPGGDGVCQDRVDVDVCLDGCTNDNQCRQLAGYRCLELRPGTPKVCAIPHKAVGDACTLAPGDCGPMPWQCLSIGFPGGYCGAMGCSPDNPSSCPAGAVCHDTLPGGIGGEICAKPCAGGNDCRTDYECVDATPTTLGKVCVPK